MSKGSLEGILVVALEQAVAAPFCTSRLADAGARVIKIERPTGDLARHYDEVAHGESAYFVWLNRGKESIALDIKKREDAALLRRIVAAADVFVQNLAPGAAARAGFGSDSLRAAHPKLITCDITGYGETGPYAEMKAYDLLIQCETGLASITGGAEGPGRVGVSVADIGCGMNAHAAILQALFARTRSGKGSGVCVSLFDGLADWMAVPLIHREYANAEPKRIGLNHATIAPYGAYAAADGRQVVISIQTETEWVSFCRSVIERPDMIDDAQFSSNSRRSANRAALDVEIDRTLSTLSYEALISRLRAANIAFGSLNSVGAFARHPQLRRVDIDTPSGPVSISAPAQIFRGEAVALGPCRTRTARGSGRNSVSQAKHRLKRAKHNRMKRGKRARLPVSDDPGG